MGVATIFVLLMIVQDVDQYFNKWNFDCLKLEAKN